MFRGTIRPVSTDRKFQQLRPAGPGGPEIGALLTGPVALGSQGNGAHEHADESAEHRSRAVISAGESAIEGQTRRSRN